MKKRIFLVSLLALLIAVAALCALPAKADGAVIYISDLGTGDGSSPDNPLGANADFLAACETGVATANISQGSALYKATKEVAAGGTIVIVGDTTVALGTTAQSSGTNNAYTYGHVGHITVTSVYDSVDYRSTNGAELVFRSTHQTLRLHLSGPMTFENLDITMLYSGSCFTYIPCRGFVTVFGEGLNMRTTTDTTLATYEDTPTSARLPRICGGYMWGSFSKKTGREDLVNLTILSGSYYTVAGCGNFPNQSLSLTGDVNMTFGACEIKATVVGMYEATMKGSVILNGNINMTFNGTTAAGNVFVTTSAGSSGSTSANATNWCKLNGDANVVINDGTTLGSTFYLTPNGVADSSSNTVNYGQIAGNANITVNAGTAGVNFARFDLGAQGMATNHASDPTKGKITIKFNGDNWYAASNTLTPHAFYFAGSGSNFVASGGYRYTVLDFSGMTYNEFWNHTNRDDTPVYNGFRYVPGYAVVPTVQPDALGIAQYGAGGAAYGVNEVIEPIDVITSISCDLPLDFTAGDHFSLANVDLTFTAQSGTESVKAVGTDIAADAFTYTDPGELTVAMDGTAISVTLPASANPLGNDVVFSVPINVAPSNKSFTNLVLTSNPDKTSYVVGETFAPAGLVLTACYDDDSEEPVDLSLVEGIPALLDAAAISNTPGDVDFTLTYTTLGVSKSVVLTLTVADKIVSVVYDNIPTATINDDAVDFSGMTAVVTYEIAGEVAATYADFTIGAYNNTIFNNQLQNRRFAVEVTYTDANGQSDIQTVFVPVVSDLTVVNNTIYISNTGTGDGQSASDPLGCDANYPQTVWADVDNMMGAAGKYLYDDNYNQIPATACQGTAIYRAIYALSEVGGGKIVVVDEASFGLGGNAYSQDYITLYAAGNVYFPAWDDEIEIVGSDASALLCYDARLNNPRVHFNGPVNVHDITFSVDYTSGSTSRPNIAFNGYNSTFDATNMVKRLFTLDDVGYLDASYDYVELTGETAHDPVISCGKMWGDYTTQNGNATVAITGGRWNQIHAGGSVSASSTGYTQTGDITVVMTGVTLTSNFYGSMNPNGSNQYVRFAGNVTVVVNEGCTFGNYFMFSKRGFTSSEYTYRLVLNAMPSTAYTIGSKRTFWTNCGSGKEDYRENLILDMSGMDYDVFLANKATLNLMFYRWDDTVVDEDGNAWGQSANTTAGFKTVIAPAGIKYVGTSIRVTGTLGIRFKFQLNDSLKTKPDFTFGVLLGKASNFANTPLEIGAAKSVDTVLVRTDDMGNIVEDRYFRKNDTNGTTTYVVVLMAKDGRWTDERRKTEYLVRAYSIIDGTLRYGNFLGTSDINGVINYTNAASGLARSIQYVAKLAQDYYSGTEYAAAVNALAAD